MRGRTHAVVAATLGLGLSLALRESESGWLAGMGLALQESESGWLVGTGLAALGGLLPDIDEPRSLIGHSPQILARGATRRSRRGSFGRVLFLVFGELLTGAVQALATAIRELVGHRGMTHWALAAVALATPLAALWGPHAGLYFLVGYLSHLALDMMTRGGVPVLGPLSRRRLHLLPPFLRVRTGGPVDRFLQFGAGIAFVLLAATDVAGIGGASWLP